MSFRTIRNHNFERKYRMPLRSLVVMYDHNGGGDIFVLYGTPESVPRQVEEAIADGSRFPNEESPPEAIGGVLINPSEELAKLLDEADKVPRREAEGFHSEVSFFEDNLFDVFMKLACGVKELAPEVEKHREAERQFSRMLWERLQECNRRR